MGWLRKRAESARSDRGVSFVASIEGQRAPYDVSSPEELDRVIADSQLRAEQSLQKLGKMNSRKNSALKGFGGND